MVGEKYSRSGRRMEARRVVRDPGGRARDREANMDLRGEVCGVDEGAPIEPRVYLSAIRDHPRPKPSVSPDPDPGGSGAMIA